MTSLYDAVFGADAVVRPGRLGVVRRVRHGDTSLVVDTKDEVGLNLNLSERHAVERRMDGQFARAAPRVGAVTLMPAGRPARFTITGECHVLQMRLPWPEMAGWLAADYDRDPSHIELQPCLHADDPALARRIYAAAVADTDETEAALYRVAACLLAGHTVRPRPATSSRGGLSPARLRRVLDLIEAELAGALDLPKLAAAAGMSPFHFAREFARMIGLPPHRYVVRRRVDRAIPLLACPTLTMADVARHVGFTHASHLARHMRRLTGLTPGTFRAQILPCISARTCSLQ